jgi:RNA polymerase sigma-70 factor (ECF subfamily)
MTRPPVFDAEGLAALRVAILAVLRGPSLGGPSLELAAAGGFTMEPHSAPSLPDTAALSLADAPADTGHRRYGGTGAIEDPEARRVAGLVDLARAGDAEAFGQLYDRYVDTVYRYIYYRVGSSQLAEDLTSETFLRALRRISSFTWQGRDFAAWLVTIARNLVVDHFKSSRFRLEVTTGEMLDADDVQESPEGTVLESFINVALLKAVKRLNPQQQECVVLRFLQGLSVAETARIMGKNEGAIKTLQYRAVRSLAQLLPEDMR